MSHFRFWWQGPCTSRVQEIENEEFLRSQVVDEIGTQESIQVNAVYYFDF